MAQASIMNRSSALSVRSRSVAFFLAFMMLIVSRGKSFQAPSQPSRTNQLTSHYISTQLSARRLNRRKSQTAAFYSNTADPPFTDKERSKSFGSRMRRLVLRQQKQERQKQSNNKKNTKKSDINPGKPSFVEEAVTLKTYKEIVADEKERVVVVRFYAKWCRACKAVEPHFYRLAHSMPDVKFVEVPVLEENAVLHQGLGVPSLPFGHIYQPGIGLVEELRMAKKEFKNFKSVVETYRAGECSDLQIDPDRGIFTSPFEAEEKEEGLTPR